MISHLCYNYRLLLTTEVLSMILGRSQSEVQGMLAPRTDVTIEEAERLIYLEGELLDDWRLDDWLKLYTGDMTYLVPSPGMPMDCSPDTSLFLINDDRFRMESRVKRLKKK